uniref:Uncharacterized protein n=1 Tax=Proteus mirabilis TaxID=584 RepID=A0A1L5JQK7_PROMI|nr:hypothetical protein [Proteus mirabilis]AQM75204.1 hypothetical protein [Proteus mirabilis]
MTAFQLEVAKVKLFGFFSLSWLHESYVMYKMVLMGYKFTQRVALLLNSMELNQEATI